MIVIFTKKKYCNIYKKNILLNTKNIQIKNLVKNLMKCYQNILYQIKILE